MIRRQATVVSCIVALTAGLPLLAGNVPSQPVQTTTTQNVPFESGGTIRLDGAKGNLFVEGWDQPTVEIVVTKSLGYNSEPKEQAAAHLDSVKITPERKSDTELVIATTKTSTGFHFPGTGPDVTVEYHIHAPRNSHLSILHSKGFFSVTGMTGDIEAANSRGDIVLMLPELASYSIDAHTNFGLVTSDAAGDGRNHHLIGEKFTSDASPTRHLTLKMGFGGITIKELPPLASPAAPAAIK
jgi:hypothetical protein